MGAEAYLFQIIPRQELTLNELKNIFQKLNIKSVNKKTSICFEKIDEKSIIEFKVYLKENNKNVVDEIFSRFCVGNPLEVIDNFFNLIKKIEKQIPVKVSDWQTKKHIYLKDEESYKQTKKTASLIKKGFEEAFGKIDTPIRCDDVWEYVKHNPDSKVIKWEEQHPKHIQKKE